jgi:hypothetical protein
LVHCLGKVLLEPWRNGQTSKRILDLLRVMVMVGVGVMVRGGDLGL